MYIPERRRLVRRQVNNLGRSCHVKTFLIEMNHVVNQGVEQCLLVDKTNDESNFYAYSPTQAGVNSVGRFHDAMTLAHLKKRRIRYSIFCAKGRSVYRLRYGAASIYL